jgi:hypothetical protein
MAEVDWLSVYELSNGDEQDGLLGDIPSRMGKAFAKLDDTENLASVSLPEQFTLTSVYPNPFNSTARVSYSLPDAASVRITIHDLTGREIAELFNGRIEAGNHSAVWNAETSAAGVYFVKVNVAGATLSEKLLLAK